MPNAAPFSLRDAVRPYGVADGADRLTLADAARALGAQREGKGYRAPCPVHGGDGFNLALDPAADGAGFVAFCHSHRCDGRAILDAIRAKVGRAPAPARTGASGAGGTLGALRAEYVYRDAAGAPVGIVRRYDAPGGKTFRQFHPDGKPGAPPALRTTPYQLPAVLKAITNGRAVVVCEGEKDADAVRDALDLAATCNAMGAGKWTAAHAAHLAGAKSVLVLPDNDAAGAAHARHVARTLLALDPAPRVKIVELPGLEDKGDVSDWLSAGGTRETFAALVKATQPATRDALDVDDPSALDDPTPVRPSAERPHADTPAAIGHPAAALGPPPLDPTAYRGLLGDAVQAIAPHTEAHPAGLLVSMLVGAGVLLGRGPHVALGPGQRHGANLFALLVGPSGRGRKGVAVHAVEALLTFLDPTFTPHVMGGLSSAEGLVHAVRDAAPATGKGEEDPGVPDKRVWIIEDELGAALKRMKGEGNTLNMTLRNAWDGRSLQTITKRQPQRATDPHLGIVGCITPAELHLLADDGDLLNGFLNRFLFAYVERVRVLPHGGADVRDVLGPIAGPLRAALRTGMGLGALGWTTAGRARWEALYAELTDGTGDGRLGELTQRGAPLVLRLATVYAVADGRAALDAGDLDAARAVWRYSVASTVRALGDRLLSAGARKLLAAITAKGAAGLARSAWRDALGSNAYAAAVLDGFGAELAAAELAHATTEPTATKPRNVWRPGPAPATHDVRHDRRNRPDSDPAAPDDAYSAYPPMGSERGDGDAAGRVTL